MCNKVYLPKWCLGHGPTNDWELYKTQECDCGMTPLDIYRQPHPYFTFRCDDCVATNRWFENSPAGIQWRHENEGAAEKEEVKLKKPVKSRLVKPKK
ncbi:Uu.00g103080.m01.CDS01 [Anthostomella pinea]|uniref:Uu.00g103080.m01.CDS01 n=1 Tax=Anthostomella pinea TaxID=933095 RepID=A0AAI8V8D7_9PEZI|nr:Uu.00g103080.m01.CDS01 [Anthostomella pinea]